MADDKKLEFEKRTRDTVVVLTREINGSLEMQVQDLELQEGGVMAEVKAAGLTSKLFLPWHTVSHVRQELHRDPSVVRVDVPKDEEPTKPARP